MNEDDLPPRERSDDRGFSGEFGQTMGGFALVAAFIAVAGVVLWIATRWF
ncbi:MAG: hypothetical protein JSR60_04160 [Proteobacteria bacterium]|nr:hypothetical protein [Pseudomonadota bacterium]